MTIHVLPGDALTENFRRTDLDGEIVVCRECLIDGDIEADSIEAFWQIRADFIEENYGEKREKYLQDVAGEFEKLKKTSAGTEINLWFEYELFCQVNFWFTLDYLRENELKLFRVAPIVRTESDIWKGFGGLEAEDLKKCFAARVRISEEDVKLGAELWKAFQKKDFAALERLSETSSEAFPYLKEVCRAAIEKHTQPRKLLREITAGGKTEFTEIFGEFAARAGVYGFGDAQVKRILAEI